MVALDSRCRQVEFAARVPSNCCKLLSGETPASSSWTSPSFPSPLLPRRLHPHVHDFCCPLQVRLSQCLRFSVTVRSRMGRQRNRQIILILYRGRWQIISVTLIILESIFAHPHTDNVHEYPQWSTKYVEMHVS